MKHEKSCGTIIIDQNKVLVIGAEDDEVSFSGRSQKATKKTANQTRKPRFAKPAKKSGWKQKS